MLVSNFIVNIVVVFFIFSLILLIYSIKNKNKNICKGIIVIDIVYIIYLFLDLVIITDILEIYFQLGIIVIGGIGLLTGLLLIISAIICFIKMKKITIRIKSKKVIMTTILLVILPIIAFLSVFFREKYLIDNSNLILEYYSRGNGGFDGQNFAYAISDNFCKQISIGTQINGYNMKKFLPKSAFEINVSDMQNIEYEITIDSTRILIYKNGKCIHERNHNGNYFNIELKRAFRIKK